MTIEILKALNAVMSEVGYVQKGGKNQFHNYRYAGEADLLEKLRPAMVKHGLILIPSGAERSPIDEHGNTHVAIDYTLAHVSGAVWPEKIRAFGSGNDRNSKGGVQDKGTYKAITGANKYLLFKLFQIETGDDPEKDEEKPDTRPAAAAAPSRPKAAEPTTGFQLISPENGAVVETFERGSIFLDALEQRMSNDDPVFWWGANSATARLIADKHPAAKVRVAGMEQLVNGRAG